MNHSAFALVALALVLRDASAHACAPAPPPGLTVRVAGEEALIVWDAEHGVEHFVRRAQFDTTAAKFGFLVPTPSTPRLGEVDASIFDTLLRVTAPSVVVRDERTFEPGCLCDSFILRKAGVRAAAEAPVRVLSLQTVAGYDAVVLEADDAAALAKWLADNGYDARASLLEWLTP